MVNIISSTSIALVEIVLIFRTPQDRSDTGLNLLSTCVFTLDTLHLVHTESLLALYSMCGQQKGTIFHSKHHETFSCQTGRTTCSSCLPYQRESIIRRAYRIMIPASSKPTSFVRAEKNFFCYIISSLSIPNSFQVEHTIALTVVHRIQSCPAFAPLFDYEPK